MDSLSNVFFCQMTNRFPLYLLLMMEITQKWLMHAPHLHERLLHRLPAIYQTAMKLCVFVLLANKNNLQ